MARILVVEDNPIHQEAARQQLATHKVTIIKSFTEFFQKYTGFEKADINEFDVVLTDMHLPSPIYTKDNAEEEAPSGLNIALYAIVNQVKYVGILTDTERHGGTAMGYSIDLFKHEPVFVGKTTFFPPTCVMKKVFQENLAKEPSLPNWVYMCCGGDSKELKEKRKEIQSKLITVKDWKFLLKELLNKRKELKKVRIYN